MDGKTTFSFDDQPDIRSMISGPIVQWETEAAAAIENGANSFMNSFRLTREAIKKSTDGIKSDIETDRKTRKL